MAALTFLIICQAYNDMAGLPMNKWLSLYTEAARAKASKGLELKAYFYGAWAAWLGAVYFLLSSMWSSKSNLFGAAKFATPGEIERAGYLGAVGVILGQLGSRYLSFPGQENIMLSAPSRSGKGQGVVIPNCLNFPDSLVNLDVKRENYDASAGFRAAHGQKVVLWNPADPNAQTFRHNFLAYIDVGSPGCIDEVQRISHWLVTSSEGEKSKFWSGNARQLFQAVCLLVLFTEPAEARHLGTVQRFALHPEGTEYLVQRLRYASENDISVPHIAVETILGLLKTAPETMNGILGEYKSHTELLNNPVTLAAISGHDFDLRDLRLKRMSLYVVMSPDDRQRLSPLLSLFFQQLISLNTQKLPVIGDPKEITCLMLLDEFTAMGRVPVYEAAVSYMAGYNLRSVIIVQTPAQLVAVYKGEYAKTMLDNHTIKPIFRPANMEDAETLSKMLGNDTVNKTSKSIGQGNNPTVSTSDHGRPLMLPQEVFNMSDDEVIIVNRKTAPIRAKKIVAWKSKLFTGRRTQFPAPPVPIQEIAEWHSVHFIRSSLANLDSKTKPATDGISNIADNPEPLSQDEIDQWISKAGGSISDADAEQVASTILHRMGAI